MTMLDEMACQELVEVITEYLEGTLPPPDRERFEAHLAVCPYCRTYLDQMRTTISAMGKIEPQSLAVEQRDRLLALFRDWRTE